MYWCIRGWHYLTRIKQIEASEKLDRYSELLLYKFFTSLTHQSYNTKAPRIRSAQISLNLIVDLLLLGQLHDDRGPTP